MPNIREPRYHKIAREIAQHIVNRQFQVGQKLHARSTLAATFGVSAETARKAISVLADLGIVKPVHGSGVEVLSREKARSFLNQAQETSDIQAIHSQINDLISQQRQNLVQLNETMGTLFDQTQQIRQHNPMSPYEFIPATDSSKLNQSIGKLNIWQNTGATIIAILHEDDLVLSPGPYAVISPGDTVYFIGSEQSSLAIRQFFEP
ncbi:GntR family transcriptional regulator [Leuconostocaceae bacterium ESL0723]|nr:GntR family transcriptional regulator [Lactobacillaceae bacterium L1_55_11]WEV54770.1 GntR family transcriptional regulator [Leuconostocaceae bacterium ESL0723]